jgi:hypothetical protein
MVRERVGVSRIGSDGWKEGKIAVRTRPGRREHVHMVRRYKESGKNGAENRGEDENADSARLTERVETRIGAK